ncbi:PPE family protein [Mycobacterium marinum]|uniref:PPE family protein n=10 Tax=Mycobacterium marinum TaxID=1781 RepID=UPI0021C3D446|nr:PPE family protein [Mycobacterium marinum]GJO22547.1 putative PPE family protein PPE61 [Mycobacterium marinum]GJO70062.1 putative PPE family protein PPE61 [Mycobacterium marinum]GJO86639.1 putative PPE family protein PPE61 [Mycobacterium marinum]GJP14046.1 putative PPE family protein PPE61 [Mycobacterium marinum]
MSFMMLPPEINSTRMYTGPGSASLRAAAASWNSISVELHSAAESYRAMIADLTSFQWLGPSSAAMIASMLPYVEWLEATAVQAGHSAMQASAAAAAYEQAFAMTVPPPAIVANRTELAGLIATNFFGQNTAAIAANEAEYAEMWATDATAMTSYSTTSATARALTPFTSPHQSTNPAGLGAQSAAVANSTANAAADGGNWLGNLIITIGEAFAPFAPEVTVALVAVGEAINALPFPSFFADDFTILDGILAFYATIGSIQNIESMSSGIIGTEDTLGLVPHAAAAAADAPSALAALGGEPAMGAELGPIAAELSSGNRIGQMSVPPSWSEPKVTTIKALQATPLTTLPTDEVPASGIPGMPGMAMTGAGRGGVAPRYGVRLTVMPRTFSGG